MDESFKKSHGVASAVKQEKATESNHDQEEDRKDQDMNIPTMENELELAKAKMREVREENQRLKMYLDKMMKDYQNLQNQFNNIVHNQQAPMKSTDDTTTPPDHHHQQSTVQEEPEFVSLSLGRSSSSTEQKRDINDQKNHSPKKAETNSNTVEQDKDQGLELGLDCKFDVHPPPKQAGIMPAESSPDNSSEDAAETWPPQKVQKKAADDDVSEQNPVKKARVSVRVRCDTPTMNDGCQWRKYGQKIAKGNPCPRAYYRCSVAPSCPVRKQVQRCSQDMSILITTYEGKHNHSLPVAAHAMASTTSAAADMLLSGSSSSTSSSTAPSPLHGLNYYFSNNPATSKSPFYNIPNTSISSSNSCPSITLDLTTTSSTNFPLRYNNIVGSSSTNLNFSNSNLDSNTTLPISWNYGSNYQLPNYNNMRSSLNFGRQHQENLYHHQHAYMQKNNNVAAHQTQQALDKNSIESATKAITSDPNFQSALAAALTSIMSSNNIISAGGTGGGQNHVKLEQSFPVLSTFLSTHSQASNSRILSTQLPNSKSKSTSPEDNR